MARFAWRRNNGLRGPRATRGSIDVHSRQSGNNHEVLSLDIADDDRRARCVLGAANHDERVTIDNLEFATRALFEIATRYCGAR